MILAGCFRNRENYIHRDIQISITQYEMLELKKDMGRVISQEVENVDRNSLYAILRNLDLTLLGDDGNFKGY